jgi:hypothetical protein
LSRWCPSYPCAAAAPSWSALATNQRISQCNEGESFSNQGARQKDKRIKIFTSKTKVKITNKECTIFKRINTSFSFNEER